MQRWQSWLFVLAIFAAPSVFAQTQGPPPGQVPSPAQQTYGPHRTIEAWGELRNLTAQLGLTPEQREKLRPIVSEEGEQMRIVRLDEHLTPDQKRQKGNEIRESFRPKIAALLTPEQQEKYKKMQDASQTKPPDGAKEPAKPAAPQK